MTLKELEYIGEMDKRNRVKEIEKIARIIHQGELRIQHDSSYIEDFDIDVIVEVGQQRLYGAKALYEEGYKVTEGAVVLTKEEYEDMQARMAYIQEELGKLLRGDNVSVSAREYGQLLYVKENAQKEIDKAVEERTIAIIKNINSLNYVKDETKN